MAPKISEEHAEARRGQILAAAIACFAEKGFHKTSMKDICNKAELSPGAVYSYFDSKEEIVENVCRMGESENADLFEQTRRMPGTMREQVEFNLGHYREMIKSPMGEQYLRADIMFYAEALTNGRLMNSAQQNYTSLLNDLQKTVEQWQKKECIRKDLDAKATAQVLLATVNGIAMQRIIDPNMDMDAYFKSLIAMIMGEFNTGKL